MNLKWDASLALTSTLVGLVLSTSAVVKWEKNLMKEKETKFITQLQQNNDLGSVLENYSSPFEVDRTLYAIKEEKQKFAWEYKGFWRPVA